MTRINREYYLHHDTLWIARDLLGKHLYCNINQQGLRGGIITETEAYLGARDRASHAYNNRRTKRTETMFQEGGVAYVYLCYGIHHLFNIVTHKEDIPHAILIRAVLQTGYPVKTKTKAVKKHPGLLDGPGKLTKALGITTQLDGLPLDGNVVWLENHQIKVPEELIISTPRIGVDYAGEDAKRPYRFVLEDKPFLQALGTNQHYKINP